MTTLTAPPAAATQLAARTRDVVKVYGSGETAVRALDGVTLDLPVAQMTAVMGPSGSGKSTLMHCLAGLDGVDSGQVFLGEDEITALSEQRRTLLRRDRIGFVFQSFNLIGSLTAAENITLPLALGGRRPDPDWYAELVRTLGIQDRLNHRPSQLSGGQQQRVAVARALIAKPRLVFADEPTGNLDSRRGAELLGLLHDAVEHLGQTVVMVTHDPSAATTAHRVVFLTDGRIVGELLNPTVDAVLARMRQLDASPEAGQE
jgi:putative ABC transport system ATP-binding protein